MALMEYTRQKDMIVFQNLSIRHRERLQDYLTWKEDVSILDEDGRPTGEVQVVHNTLVHEHDGAVWTYLGLEEPLKALLPMSCVDDLAYGKVIPPKPEIRKDILPPDGDKFEGLMEFQLAAISKCIQKKIGIIKLPTASGKTEIISGICRYLLENGLAKKLLIVEPSIQLVDQTKARFIKRGFSESEIGLVYGKVKQTDRSVTIASPDTLRLSINQKDKSERSADCNRILDLMGEVDAVFYDECHSCGSSEYQTIELHISPEYKWGFSATPISGESPLESYRDAYVFGVLGGVIFTLPSSYLVQIGLNSQCYSFFKKLPGLGKFHTINYQKLYDKEIVRNSVRNEYICRQVRRAVGLSLPVLISVTRHEHAKILMSMMPDLKVISVFGSGESFEFRDKQVVDSYRTHDEVTAGFLGGEWDVIIASPVFDQGFDISNIILLVIAGGMKSRTKTLQRRGRGSRSKEHTGLNRFYLMDFEDRSHVYLLSQSKKRKKFYEEEGSIIVGDEYQFVNMMHEHSDVIKRIK